MQIISESEGGEICIETCLNNTCNFCVEESFLFPFFISALHNDFQVGISFKCPMDSTWVLSHQPEIDFPGVNSRVPGVELSEVFALACRLIPVQVLQPCSSLRLEDEGIHFSDD